jgi:hypothetical protein
VTKVEHADTAKPVTDAEPEPAEPRRRRRSLAWLAVGVVVVAAGAGVSVWVSSTSTEPATTETGPVATAVVERGTISATAEWDGTLGHGTPFTVTSGAEGTVTRLAEQGEPVERGDALYRLNEQPVTLLFGAVPMYRDLAPGDSGADVDQLEDNLESLGYNGFTADAVREWQADIGVDKTGIVSRSDVVFLPAGGRIDVLRVGVGDRVSPGTPILDVTGADQVVSLEADVSDRDQFDVDTGVTIALPGGDQVPGTVSTIAAVEVGVEGQEETTSIVQVEITLDEQVGNDLIGASVDVIVAIDEREDVLLVPVNALLALSEGGYGLEIVADDGTTAIVPVTTGLFADGTVQVDGDDIAEGTVVGVAGR